MLEIEGTELERWRALTERMTVPFHGDGIISQFEGYEQLAEFDWGGYRERYGSIERLDRILKAEGDSPDRYQVSKQADVDMLFFLLGERELSALIRRLGYTLDDDQPRRNVEYYSTRTSHGSTLSRVVFASTIHRLDPEQGLRLFLEALRSDVDDLQGGTTAEGIHLGAMAGTVGLLFRHYAGVDLGPDGVTFDPHPPSRFRRLAFRVQWHGCWVAVNLSSDRVALTVDDDAPRAVPVRVHGTAARLLPGESRLFQLDRPAHAGSQDGAPTP
jgi:trehalose/maltose hydrolase-like predicted phosphorylase